MSFDGRPRVVPGRPGSSEGRPRVVQGSPKGRPRIVRSSSKAVQGTLRRDLAQTLRLIFRCVLRKVLRNLAWIIFRWLIFSLKYCRAYDSSSKNCKSGLVQNPRKKTSIVLQPLRQGTYRLELLAIGGHFSWRIWQ